jgi:hypothetical protein
MTTEEEIQELKDTAQKLLDKAKELETLESGYWEPGSGVKYWYIDHFGNLSNYVWYGKDNTAIDIGNYYRTKAEAHKELERRKALQRIRKYIHENMPFKYNINGVDTDRYAFFYNGATRSIDITKNYYLHNQPDWLYVGSEEDAEKLIEDMEEDLKIYLGVE